MKEPKPAVIFFQEGFSDQLRELICYLLCGVTPTSEVSKKLLKNILGSGLKPFADDGDNYEFCSYEVIN